MTYKIAARYSRGEVIYTATTEEAALGKAAELEDARIPHQITNADGAIVGLADLEDLIDQRGQ